MKFAGLRSIARNTAYLTASQVIGLAARLAYVVLVARLLGPDLYALLAYSQTWYVAFLPVALFGLGSAVVHSIAPDRERAADIAARALVIRLLTTAVAAIACVGLSRIFVPDPRAPVLIAILAAGLVGRSLTAWAQHLFAAFEINYLTALQEPLFRIMDLALAVIILTSDGGVVALVTVQAAVWCLQAGVSLAIVQRRLFRLGLDWRPSELRPLLVLCVPFFVIALALSWRINGAMVLFRNLTTDGVLFGQFALAMQAVAYATIAPVALSAAAQPVLRRSARRGDGKDIRYASAVHRTGLVTGAAAGLLGLAFGKPLVVFVLGPEYAKAGQLLGLTLWCLIPLMAGNGYPPVMVARGQFREQAVVSVLGAVLMTLLMFVLVPPFGVTGAIAAAFGGFALPPLLIYLQIWRQGLADPGPELLRPLLAIGIALGCFHLLAPLSTWAALTGGILSLAVAVLVLGVVGIDELQRIRRFSW